MIGLPGILTFLAYLLITGFFLRFIIYRWPESAAAQALAFIY